VQLQSVIASVQDDDEAAAILLRCAGRTFMAGADITEFDHEEIPAPDPNEIHALLEASAKPIVAAMHGTCLGAGLELALSCHFRVASSSAEFGLPEVRLGVIPGAGGTQRLPRLIGFQPAVQMISTGNRISAQEALGCGLIDAVFDGDLCAHALEYTRTIIGSDIASRVLSRRALKLTQDDEAFVGRLEASLPEIEKGGIAIREAIEAVGEAGTLPFEQALSAERRRFMYCRDTQESKALRHAFFAVRTAAIIPNLPAGLQLRSIKMVGIMGAGTMGTGIAMSFANAGIPVILQDIDDGTLARARDVIHATYGAAATKMRMSAAEAKARTDLIRCTLDDTDLVPCDLIIEAIFEDFEMKKTIFRRLGHIAKPGAIIASNTSSLDVNILAHCSGRPKDVLGMHFFSPAHIMRLLEVVRCDTTAPEVLATIMQLARRINKVAVVSGVCFGFIGNRMLEGYLRETEFLLLEGATPGFIDQSLEAHGLAMGPCRMIDMAGIDVAANVVLEQKKAGRIAEDDSYRCVVQALHELGRHGQKTGKGYYRYEGRIPREDETLQDTFRDLARKHGIRQRNDISRQEVIERCLYPLMAEGYRILEEGIAYRSSDIDVVWIHGYGFPAYLGGPMFHARTIGEHNVAASMKRFAQRYGNAQGYWDIPHSLSTGRAAD